MRIKFSQDPGNVQASSSSSFCLFYSLNYTTDIILYQRKSFRGNKSLNTCVQAVILSLSVSFCTCKLNCRHALWCCFGWLCNVSLLLLQNGSIKVLCHMTYVQNVKSFVSIYSLLLTVMYNNGVSPSAGEYPEG